MIRVKPGQTVYFTTLGDSRKRYYGKLRSVAPAPSSIEQDTGGRSPNASGGATQAVYYNAIFEVPNPDGELRIAMTAQVNVVLAEAKQVLTIPSAALGEQAADGGYTVQVPDARGLPQPRRITVGINNNVNAQVTSGLAAGDQVVVGMAMPGARPSGGPHDHRAMTQPLLRLRDVRRDYPAGDEPISALRMSASTSRPGNSSPWSVPPDPASPR